MWGLFPENTNEGMRPERRPAKRARVVKQVTPMGTRTSPCWGTLGVRVEYICLSYSPMGGTWRFYAPLASLRPLGEGCPGWVGHGHYGLALLASRGGRQSRPSSGPQAVMWGPARSGPREGGLERHREADRCPGIQEEPTGRHVWEMLLSQGGCGYEQKGTDLEYGNARAG